MQSKALAIRRASAVCDAVLLFTVATFRYLRSTVSGSLLLLLGGLVLPMVIQADQAQPEGVPTLPGPAATAPVTIADSADAARRQFECRAPEGESKLLTLQASHSELVVNGTMQIAEPYIGHGYAALGGLYLKDEQNPKRGVGFFGLIQQNSPNTILFYVANGEYHERFASISASRQEIPFTVALVAPDRMKVTIAGVSKSLGIRPLPTWKLALECWDAAVKFQNVTLGAHP